MEDSTSTRDEPTKKGEVNGLVDGLQQLQLQESTKEQQQSRDSINIFLPCRDRHSSIAINCAVREVRARYNAKKWRIYWINNKCSVENHHCGLCEASFDFHVFKHFLSPPHINKVRDHGGSISLGSLRYLLSELQKASDWATHSSHEEQETDNPLNIFKLCRPDAPESIPLDEATSQMRAKFDECGKRKWEIYCTESTHEAWLVCKVCQKDLRRDKHTHLSHFLSQGHQQKMLRSGGTISLPALQHWLNELQLAADVQLPVDPPPKPKKEKINLHLRFVPKKGNKNKNNKADDKKKTGKGAKKNKTGNGTANNKNNTGDGKAANKNPTGSEEVANKTETGEKKKKRVKKDKTPSDTRGVVRGGCWWKEAGGTMVKLY